MTRHTHHHRAADYDPEERRLERSGRIYAITRPAFYVDCAVDTCGAEALIAPAGRCRDFEDARRTARHDSKEPNLEISGWTCRGGLWFCPDHS